MSAVKETIIYCDQCGENHGADDRNQSAYEIRKNRKTWGWIQRGSKDFCCPECEKKYNNPIQPDPEKTGG